MFHSIRCECVNRFSRQKPPAVAVTWIFSAWQITEKSAGRRSRETEKLVAGSLPPLPAHGPMLVDKLIVLSTRCAESQHCRRPILSLSVSST